MHKENPQKQLVAKAEKALKEAVAKTIEDHRLTGDPIVVWKDGKVVKVPAEQLGARETRGRTGRDGARPSKNKF